MLTIQGRKQRFCDGMTRRDALHIGAVAMGSVGFGLSDLLRAEGESAARASGKNLINIFLHGGPTHMDTFDLKPEAPVEYRGEFRPIATNVPGVEICELMPELAGVADNYSIIRSTRGMNNEHTTNQGDSGWSVNAMRAMGGRPGVGAVMAKLWGPAQQTSRGMAPTAVDFGGSRPGFLGQTYAPYRPDTTGRQNLVLKNVTLDRLDNRRNLLTGLDRLKKGIDRRGMFDAVDQGPGHQPRRSQDPRTLRGQQPAGRPSADRRGRPLCLDDLGRLGHPRQQLQRDAGQAAADLAQVDRPDRRPADPWPAG